MPLRASRDQPANSHPAFFSSLQDLDIWAEQSPELLDGILKFVSRRPAEGVPSDTDRGKLLTCHDYKGGYQEKTAALSYTFNFWSLCEIFIYFAHHRVTIPPPGWINAAHRQGVAMLGTLIFEWDGAEEECLRLLLGNIPLNNKDYSHANPGGVLPISPHYAHLLARLARQRGFDGYLLNIECPLRGGVEQVRALVGWITILERELRAQVGHHAHCIWYDSVIVDGNLRWQNRLNSFNLPLFLPSTGFFTNYFWLPDYPTLTAKYFHSLHESTIAHPTSPKRLNDIYIGVDVWGRNQHGGGGMSTHKAIHHIDPGMLGLSVALFGHAWTWESEQDKPGWDWQAFWKYERTLWVGNGDDDIIRVPAPPSEGPASDCNHDEFKPVGYYFPTRPPPNPLQLPFYTCFSPGVGLAWFVEGVQVLQTLDGWTDVDKNCSLGDLAWPRPKLVWEGEEEIDEDPPKASASMCMTDAWMGGSSLEVSFPLPKVPSGEDMAFRCIWIPIQSIAVTPRQAYHLTVFVKPNPSRTEPAPVDVDIGASVKVAPKIQASVEITPISHNEVLPNGWSKLSLQFTLLTDHPSDVLVAVGLVVGFVVEDSTPLNSEFNALVGALSAHPSTPGPTSSSSELQPHLLSAEFLPGALLTVTPNPSILAGMLSWNITSFFTPLERIVITSPEDPNPVWLPPSHPTSIFPKFLYFNIYVQLLSLVEAIASSSSVTNPPSPNLADLTFIGTTGLEGWESRFYVDDSILPIVVVDQIRATEPGKVVIRFWIQGITDRGEVLAWKRCVFVDVEVPPNGPNGAARVSEA